MKRKKEEYHKNKIDRLCDIMLLSLIPFLLIICILIIFSEKVYASTGISNSLPYYVDNSSFSYGGHSIQEINTFLNNRHNANYDFTKNTIIYKYQQGSETRLAVFTAQPNTNSIYYFSNWSTSANNFNTSSDRVSLTITHCCKFNLWLNSANQISEASNNINTTQTLTLFGTYYFPLYIGSKFYDNTYVSNVLIEGDNVILTNELGPILPEVTGHATPPEEFQSPIYTTGHTPPTNVPPTITVNNYNWTTYTPPTIDDSGIIEVIKSEIQVINYLAGWLKDNLQGMLTNLVNNIKNLFNYLVETIQYYGDLIISNIQNLITTFYNNMISIGEDITNKLTYIVSPLDTTALQTAIQNTGIYNDYDRIFDMVGDAFGFYNDITEPNTFTIPIDLRNVTILHQTQIVYIDLGWLNSCKTIIRAFMWCVLTFGLLYTIIDSIPDYLQGNDE